MYENLFRDRIKSSIFPGEKHIETKWETNAGRGGERGGEEREH
jgi:hypothetical protein